MPSNKTKVDAKPVEKSVAKSGDNLPAFSLPLLDKLVPDRLTFRPELTDAIALRKETIAVLKEVDSFSLKGDTSIYSRLTRLIAEICWQHTQGMGMKEGVETSKIGQDIAVKGIQLAYLTKKGIEPNADAWKRVRGYFLEEVDKAGTESANDFVQTMDSPSIKATIPACYRAAILICIGAADIRVFSRKKRPSLGIESLLEGTTYDAKKHVEAPAAPCNLIQPEIVREPAGKVGKTTYDSNPDKYYTYLSGTNAMLLYDRIFGEDIVIDDKKGTLKRKAIPKGPKTQDKKTPPVKKTEVHLGEGSKPEDVWQGMQAMTRDMKTGEVEIPEETQKQAVSIVQEMVENLDKKGIEALSGDLVNLQHAITSQCEASGIPQNIFVEVVDRLEDIPDIFKLPDEDRLPIMTIYKIIEGQIKSAA